MVIDRKKNPISIIKLSVGNSFNRGTDYKSAPTGGIRSTGARITNPRQPGHGLQIRANRGIRSTGARITNPRQPGGFDFWEGFAISFKNVGILIKRGRTRMGGWAVAQSPILGTTITLERLRKRGYVAMLTYYEKIAPHLNEPLYKRTARTVV